MVLHDLNAAQQLLVMSINVLPKIVAYRKGKHPAKNTRQWENTAVSPNKHYDWLQAGWLRIDSH
jgi:hypothetical protein